MFDSGGSRIDTTSGVDANHDGVPDTLMLPCNGPESLMAVDLDRDGVADLMLRIAADDSVHSYALDAAGLNQETLTALLPMHAPDPLAISLWHS